MVPKLPPHILSQPESGIRLITEQAWAVPGAIVLSVGEPRFPLAPHVTAAAVDAWKRDDTNYTANEGIPPLTAAIGQWLRQHQGVEVDEDRIMVTAGAVQGMHLALSMTVGAGDEILVPDPGYTIFDMGPHLIQAVPVHYPLRAEDDFLPSIEALEALVTPRTRAILVNSPSNPLGQVIQEDLIRSLYAFARRHDLWIVSDECYAAFTRGIEHFSPLRIDEDSRVFAVYSTSKTYGMTGVRVGWAVCPPGLSGTLNAVQEATVSCINTPAQWAAVAALTGPQDYVDDARAYYAAAAAEASAVLTRRGLRYLDPRGAFYLWVDVSHVSGGDVSAWTLRFLADQGVAVAPGSAFGRLGEGWVRISLAGDRAELLEALRRIPAPADSAVGAGSPFSGLSRE